MRDVVVQQRVHTVSRKSERLVNLTIALLATKRYLTKSEIFRTVEGYEGAPEAMERMFERDKDDLRELGVPIETVTVGHHEQPKSAYTIERDRYELIAGERRWRASQRAGLSEVPVLVRDVDDKEALDASRFAPPQPDDSEPEALP